MNHNNTATLQHGTSLRSTLRNARPAGKHGDHGLPQSLEAEQGVLGCIMLSPADSLPECLQAFKGSNEVFHDLRHRSVFESIRSLAEKGAAIDIITLSQHLRDRGQLDQIGGVGYLSQLADTVPSAANLEYYVGIVLEKHLLRRVLEAADEIATWVRDNPQDVPQLLDRVERHILEINSDRVGVAENRMLDIMRQAQATIQDLFERQGELKGIPSGFRDLDRKYTNGFNGGEMIVIAARPSVGKTSFAMNIAEHVAVGRGLPVGVFSLEMSAESLGLRLLCSRARVNLSDVREGFLADPDFRRLAVAASALAKAPLYIDDTGGITILELRAKARRMKQKYNIALFVVDYLQLVHPENMRLDARHQEVAEISSGLKEMAKELKVPVIVLSQMNRDYEREPKKRKPRLSDLRESGAIEQDSDFVGLLYKAKEEDENQAANARPAEGIAVNLLIAKHRNGPTGEVALTFLKGYTRFESAAPVSDEDVPTMEN
ncbi:MAG TPA: replicative DNA helicase [Candidatus Paceibacterota bacterium]|nr:replicative DNA helicase [Verrucomicrobiota bacterium]HSA09342.1 replicative DNA helicase [Candidatus Paceibacterota bacterium]